MTDNFFEDKNVEDQTQTTEVPEKVTVGGVEYTQVELDRLVGLGKIGVEAEEKFKTRIDKVWPNFQKIVGEKQALEVKLAEREQREAALKEATGQPLSPEELKAQAKVQGKELGIMFQEDFDSLYLQRRSAEKLLEDAQVLIDDAKTAGKPETTMEALLTHMTETGIKNPDKAYRDMFEDELEKWKVEQTKKATPQGMFTSSQSQAGSKEPKPIKWAGMKQDELGKLVAEAMAGGGQ